VGSPFLSLHGSGLAQWGALDELRIFNFKPYSQHSSHHLWHGHEVTKFQLNSYPCNLPILAATLFKLLDHRVWTFDEKQAGELHTPVLADQSATCLDSQSFRISLACAGVCHSCERSDCSREGGGCCRQGDAAHLSTYRGDPSSAAPAKQRSSEGTCKYSTWRHSSEDSHGAGWPADRT
jgi:hypothetical protein